MSSQHQGLRKKRFVDLKVQGALVIRVIVYWLVCVGTIGLMLLCWSVLSHPDRFFHLHLNDLVANFGPAALASLMLLPLVVVDVVQTSHRFVGPMIRVRQTLQALGRGEKVSSIRFRRGDFWQDFAGELNAVSARLEAAQQQVRQLEAKCRQLEEAEPVAAGH